MSELDIESEVEALEQHLESEGPTEEPEVEAEQAEAESEPKEQSRSQNAKQRLRRKLGEAEARNEKLAETLKKEQDRIDALEAKVNGVINPPAARPDRVDFETEEAYEDALYDYRSSKTPAKAEEKVEQPVNQGQRKDLVSDEVRENWLDRIDDAKDKYEDFGEKITAIPKENMTDIMTISIMESEMGGEVAYYLGTNIAEAARISKLSMAAQVREIDKISNKLKPSTSKAPSPIAPAKGGDKAVVDLESMSPDEYRAHRRKQRAGQR